MTLCSMPAFCSSAVAVSVLPHILLHFTCRPNVCKTEKMETVSVTDYVTEITPHGRYFYR